MVRFTKLEGSVDPRRDLQARILSTCQDACLRQNLQIELGCGLSGKVNTSRTAVDRVYTFGSLEAEEFIDDCRTL
jgi:hypothetical protein